MSRDTLEIVPRTESTQLELKNRLAAEPDLESFFAVQALQQTGGRGRQGRSWVSPKGNLYLSVLLRRELFQKVDTHTWIPIRVAMAAMQALLSLGGDPSVIKLKWPNDLVCVLPNESFPNQKGVPQKLALQKLGGILVEKVGEHYIAGIGINVASSPEVDQPTQFLHRVFWIKGNSAVDLSAVCRSVMEAIREEFTSDPVLPSVLKARFSRLSVFSEGQEISWRDQMGIYQGLGDWGELLIQLKSGESTSLFSEDIS